MGIQDGKRNVEAIDAFNAISRQNSGVHTPLQMAALTLQKRPLGEKHFEQIESFLNSIRNASQIKAIDNFNNDSNTPLKARRMQQLLCYMGSLREDDGNGISQADKFCPVIIQTDIIHDAVTYMHRAMPLILSSEHVEARHVRHTAKNLDYQGNDFHRAMSFSLPFAIAHSRIMKENNTEYLPTVIPVKDGFYSGHAFACDDKDFWPIHVIMAMHTGLDGKPILIESMKDVQDTMEPDWSPQSYSYIQTLVSRNDFYPRQEELFEMLNETIAETCGTGNDTKHFINAYSSCLLKDEKHEKILHDLVDNLCTIMRSKLWKSAVLDKTTPAMLREFGISAP